MKYTVGAVLLGFAPLLSGCLGTTRIVPIVKTASSVQNATLDQLMGRIDAQFDAIHTLNAAVMISATTPGKMPGEVKDSTSLRGYIFVRKPEDLRVLLLAPFIGTRAVDMVSNGKEFTLLMPTRNKALMGTNVVTEPSKNPLENLRPAVFFDSLLVRSVGAEEYVTLTESSRQLEPETKKREAILEPDYDISVLKAKTGKILERLRTIHISRVDLEPYQQDIYDNTGRLVTTVQYANYQKFGDLQFPTLITINRPFDQYTLRVTVQKLTPNQKMDDDQFQLEIPAGVTVEKLK